MVKDNMSLQVLTALILPNIILIIINAMVMIDPSIAPSWFTLISGIITISTLIIGYNYYKQENTVNKTTIVDHEHEYADNM